jgi:hypothetical protein
MAERIFWIDASAPGAVRLDTEGHVQAVRDKAAEHIVAQQPLPQDRPVASTDVFAGGAIQLGGA